VTTAEWFDPTTPVWFIDAVWGSVEELVVWTDAIIETLGC
jgi:hypothetical protein